MMANKNMKTLISERIICVVLVVMLVAAAVFCVFLFILKGNIKQISTIRNYKEWLVGNRNNVELQPDSQVEPTHPKHPTINNFSFKKEVTMDAVFIKTIDDYLYVSNKEGNFLSQNGVDFIQIFNDLSNTISFIQVSTSLDGKYGLVNALGETIVECRYDELIYKEKTVIAYEKIRNCCDIYYEGMKILTLNTEASQIVIQENSRYITVLTDSYPKHFDLMRDDAKVLELNDVVNECSDNEILWSCSENLFIIFDPYNMQFGFASSERVIIKPKYDFAELLGNKCALATLKNGDREYIITDGNHVKIFKVPSNLAVANIGAFYNKYAVFYMNQRFGLINSNFEVVIEPEFDDISYEILDDFILNPDTNVFYSIIERRYITESYESIDLCKNFYICRKNSGETELLGLDLIPLTDSQLEAAYYFNDYLIIIYDGATYLYSRKN